MLQNYFRTAWRNLWKNRGLSILIATPVAWWAMHKWLQDFAYHIPVSISIFVLAGGLAIFIALATISFQSVKAALSNPVKSLRTE